MVKTMTKSLIKSAVLLALILAMLIPAFAMPGPFQLSVELQFDNTPIPGSEFRVFRVADMDTTGAFTLLPEYVTDELKTLPADPNGWDNEPALLTETAVTKLIDPDFTETTDNDGRAVFPSTIQTGLYLVIGKDVEIDGVIYGSLPFLVALPSWNEVTQSWETLVVARPKAGVVEPIPTPTPTPAPPTSTPTGSDGKTTTVVKEKLPQTGMLWWPVPVLLTLGPVFILLGVLKTAIRLKKRAFANLLLVLGILCVLGAGGLTGYNLYDDARANEAAREAWEQVTDRLPPPSARTEKKLSGPMPVSEIDGVNYVAALTIPSLSLELPVKDEWSYVGLRTSPCRYAGSAYDGDLCICAHNYSYHFGLLKNLNEGDEVLLADMAGNVFHYKVAKIETLMPYDSDEMKNSDYELSLFTCTLGGASRVTVRCTQTEVVIVE